MILNQISIIGLTIFGYPELLAEADTKLVEAVVAGKIVLEGTETVVDVAGRVEEIPGVWRGLFTGANTGKLITKLAA